MKNKKKHLQTTHRKNSDPTEYSNYSQLNSIVTPQHIKLPSAKFDSDLPAKLDSDLSVHSNYSPLNYIVTSQHIQTDPSQTQ